MNLSRISKAIVAFFAAPVTAFLGNLEEALRTGAAINWKLLAVTLVLGAWTSFIVWAVPNTPPA